MILKDVLSQKVKLITTFDDGLITYTNRNHRIPAPFPVSYMIFLFLRNPVAHQLHAMFYKQPVGVIAESGMQVVQLVFEVLFVFPAFLTGLLVLYFWSKTIYIANITARDKKLIYYIT